MEKTMEMQIAEGEDMDAELLAGVLIDGAVEMPLTEQPRPLLLHDEYVYIMNAIKNLMTPKQGGRQIALNSGHCQYLVEQFGKNLMEFLPARGLMGVCQHELQPIKPHPEEAAAAAKEGLATLFG